MLPGFLDFLLTERQLNARYHLGDTPIVKYILNVRYAGNLSQTVRASFLVTFHKEPQAPQRTSSMYIKRTSMIYFWFSCNHFLFNSEKSIYSHQIRPPLIDASRLGLIDRAIDWPSAVSNKHHTILSAKTRYFLVFYFCDELNKIIGSIINENEVDRNVENSITALGHFLTMTQHLLTMDAVRATSVYMKSGM
jgi:hypothetical protein